jgi:ABC-2 type transport system ATP-binding protein
VKKLVLEFGRQPPAFPDMPGVVGSRQMGTRLEVVVAPFSAEHRTKAESLGPRELEIVDLNLEDAFIEYTRGTWRPLPILGGDRELAAV